MRNISNECFVATKVQIEFEDGPMSFRIPRGATLGDVSEKLHNICEWHRGGARSIDVRFGAAQGQPRLRAPLMLSSISQLSAPPAVSR